MRRKSTLGRRVVRTAGRRRTLGQPGWPSNFGGGYIWGPPRWARPVFGPSGMIGGPFGQAPSGMIGR